MVSLNRIESNRIIPSNTFLVCQGAVSDGREETSPTVEPLGFEQGGRCSPSNQVNIDVDDE